MRPRLARLTAAARRLRAVLHAVIGVPDYERYLALHRTAHPGCTPLDRAAFERDRLAARYSRPGSRCC